METSSYGNYPNLCNVKRILVIKLRHHGDVLLTSPVFANLRHRFPKAAIDAFIYKDTLPMLEGHPAISQYLLYDKGWKQFSWLKRVREEVRLLKKIQSGNYDLVINLTEGDRGAIAAKVSKAKCRVGLERKKSLFLANAFTHVVKSCPHPRHTVEKQLDALRRIGIFPEPEERDLFLHIPQEARDKIAHFLMQEEVRVREYIVIHPTSRWKFKCLSTKQTAELIQALDKRGECIVITAGPDSQELAMVEEILSLVPQIPLLNLSGKLTLKEFAACIAMSKALICVDSVPLHIASATKTPVVAMFGPTSDQNWGPWMHRRSKVVAEQMSCRPCYRDGCGGSKRSDCLYRISQQAILSALDEVLISMNSTCLM